jgi:uncharacterized cupredoxin-like copper-binding protein
MKFARRNWMALAAVAAFSLSAGQAFAKGTAIKVSPWDKGAMSMHMLADGLMFGMGMGMGQKAGQQQKGPMGITATPRTVPAGEVTFAVTNASKTMVHEMVLAPLKDQKTPLPYDKATQKVDEDAAGHLGEVAELEPGKNGALTMTLKPGRYMLYCHIAGHHALGMWTLITVK